MSIPVSLDRVRAAVEERGPGAYVLTVSEDGRPHAVHGAVSWEETAVVAEVGRRTAANAEVRPLVSLLFPVRAEGDYSLIVDGMATVERTATGQRLLLTPSKAVLHRPATVPDPTSSCSADCEPLLSPPRPRS